MKCKILILTILIHLTLTNLSISSTHIDELVITKNITQLNPDIDIEIVKQISKSISNNSKIHNLSWKIIVSIINTESKFNRKAKNGNCYGLMQINISAHRNKLKKLKLSARDLFHIPHNINLGCIILKEYMKETKNLNKALKRYSGGSSQYVKKINRTVSKIGNKKYANVDGKS